MPSSTNAWAQGVPFARDYGGLLANRSFGGALVSRTFYARGQTGQQLLLGCYGAMNRQIEKGQIKVYNRHEVLDVVLIEGKARGVIGTRLGNRLESSVSAHTPLYWQPEVTVTCLPLDKRHGSNGSAAMASLQTRCIFRQSLFRTNSPDLYSGTRRTTK